MKTRRHCWLSNRMFVRSRSRNHWRRAYQSVLIKRNTGDWMYDVRIVFSPKCRLFVKITANAGGW